MKFGLFLMMFLFLGAFFIISNENLHLAKKTEFIKFGNGYYSWIGGLFGNTVSVIGYAVKSDWLPSSGNLSEGNSSSGLS